MFKRFMKGYASLSFSYFKGPLISTFRTDASYEGIISFIAHYMKMQEDFPLQQCIHNTGQKKVYEKSSFFSIGKGFLLCQNGMEKSKGLDLGLEPLCIEFCTVPPPSGSKYSDDCEFYSSNLMK